MVNDRHGPQALHYAHVATCTGALRFASVTKNEDLRRRLVERFDAFLPPTRRACRTDDVDAAVFAQLQLELYVQQRRFGYRVMGLAFADAQWDSPLPGGLRADALVDRRHVHDHCAAAASVARDG